MSHIQLVYYRHQHHSKSTGYSCLADYIGHPISAQPLSRRLIRNKVMWRIARGVPAYNRESLATELKAGWHLLRNRDTIYHVLYGENSYKYLGYLNNVRGNQVVATFHQPPARFQQVIDIDDNIRRLAAAVCVGSNQLDVFRRILPRERVYHIRHGVNTDRFVPPAAAGDRDDNLCVFVGFHLRDFPTFRGVVEHVALVRPKARFVAVVAPNKREFLGVHPNLRFVSGISEEQLIQLYQRAALMVTPFLDVTANNAVLEALACGLPIVTTDVGAIRDYVTEKCAALLPPRNSRQMAETVLALLDNPAKREVMAHDARSRALELSWPKIVDQYRDLYASLLPSP